MPGRSRSNAIASKAGTRPLPVVGEAGPELFIPSQSGRIVANGTSGAAGLAGLVVNLNIGGSVVSERDLVDAVYDGLLARQRQIGALGLT